jgi:hypothetical protein
MRTWSLLIGLVVLALAQGNASAQSTKIYEKYKGQIVAAADPISMGDNDADNLSMLKRVAKTTFERPEGKGSWAFTYVGFMSRKPGTASINLVFYDVTAKKQRDLAFVRDVSVDPDSVIMLSDIEFTDDDVTPGHTYEVCLAQMVNGREVVYAKVKLTFK